MPDPLNDAVYLWPLKWAGRQVFGETEGFIRDAEISYAKTEDADDDTLGELKTDSPESDSTAIALTARSESYDRAADLNWLIEGAQTQEPARKATPDLREEGSPLERKLGPPPEAPVTDWVKRMVDDKQKGLASIPSEGKMNLASVPITVARDLANPLGGAIESARMLAGDADMIDFAVGASELPRQVVGGLRDAAQNTYDFLDWMDRHAEALPGFRANRMIGRLVGFEKLPEVGEPRTVAGSVARHVAQFLAPFGAFRTAMGGLRPRRIK